MAYGIVEWNDENTGCLLKTKAMALQISPSKTVLQEFEIVRLRNINWDMKTFF